MYIAQLDRSSGNSSQTIETRGAAAAARPGRPRPAGPRPRGRAAETHFRCLVLAAWCASRPSLRDSSCASLSGALRPRGPHAPNQRTRQRACVARAASAPGHDAWPRTGPHTRSPTANFRAPLSATSSPSSHSSSLFVSTDRGTSVARQPTFLRSSFTVSPSPTDTRFTIFRPIGGRFADKRPSPPAVRNMSKRFIVLHINYCSTF